MAWVAVAVAGVQLISGIAGKNKQKKAASKQNEATRLRNLREERNFIKQARQARAEALIQTIASGADIESSGNQGVQSSLRSQQIDTQEFLRRQSDLGQQANAALARSQNYATIGAVAGAVGSIYGGFQDTKATKTAKAPEALPDYSTRPANQSPFVGSNYRAS